MNNRLRWVIPLPLLIFVASVWIYVQTENEVRVQIARAQQQWRAENYAQAIDFYEFVYENYPKSQYADDVLWEIGTIYYINFYDVERALLYFHKLVTQYPDSSLAVEAYLRLAEIHEVELADLPRAIAYWNQILTLNMPLEFRRQARFQIGNAYFKLNQFEEAFQTFQLLMEDGNDDQISDRARARVGTIMQIQNQYERSVEYFNQVLENTDCSECRRAARLGLIESYEFLGDLSKAMEIAQTIPASEFPADMKQELVKRLGDKARYYEPNRWNDQ